MNRTKYNNDNFYTLDLGIIKTIPVTYTELKELWDETLRQSEYSTASAPLIYR